MREKFSAPSYQTKYLFALYLYKSAKYDENVLAQNYALDTNLPNWIEKSQVQVWLVVILLLYYL